MWEGAVDVLVGNSVNLMHSIEELIKDAEVAAVVSRARTKDGECRSIGRRVTSIGKCRILGTSAYPLITILTGVQEVSKNSCPEKKAKPSPNLAGRYSLFCACLRPHPSILPQWTRT